jgi:N-carbamoylputrescine amidase
MRVLKVAGIQVESRNLEPEENLRRAEGLVAVAAELGAELVLCPEFLAPGYVYHRSLWSVAEPQGGATETWLAAMARRHGVSIGATYLEARGEDFFNTFTLMAPDGTVAGRVSKESLPGFEGWFFRSCSGPRVIETSLGRIGVGICWDNNTSRFMRRLQREGIDLLLMPHSAPRIALGPWTLIGDQARQTLREMAGFYATAFGVPTVMANKAAGEDSWSPVPCVPLVRLRFRSFGQSTICQADGTVSDQLGEGPGVVFAAVALDDSRKVREPRIPAGYWSRRPRWFPGPQAAMYRTLEWIGRAGYGMSWARRRAARRGGPVAMRGPENEAEASGGCQPPDQSQVDKTDDTTTQR